MGRLLIIDDDEVDRKAFLRALKTAGWEGEITQASTADQALGFAKAQPFDCILLDYRLPGQDGLDVLTRLRSEGIQTPIIMLTGEGNEMVAVEAMKRGAVDYIPKSQVAAESLFKSVRQAIERAHLQRELAETQKQLEHQALYDTLTGLGNRNLFMRDLAHRVAASARNGRQFSVLLMDLDRFKHANDTYGHDAGDFILAGFGKRLKSLGRASDTFYRLGGDEFTAIVDSTDEASIATVKDKIRDVTAPTFDYKTHVMSIGVSIGSARFPLDGDAADTLLKAADAAMYAAKHAGRGPAPH
jgi:diguanylate cyclase (GGDEF)-like protein